MTEFEWFHWWPFKWLIALLCLNMSIVTLRKIPFNILTAGVWTIHTGVIVLVLGCLVYFSQKIEGDVLVSRREVVVQAPGFEPVTMVVTPGNTVEIGNTTYTITDIDPYWELLSGDDAGKRAYTVTVSVTKPDESFMRQLIAGYPEYTEDIMQSGDPEQPMARAKNVVGRALVDEDLVMNLAHDEKELFYITQSGALYIRELTMDGTPKTNWIERPIANLPRFNDYITNYDEVRIPRGTHSKLDPLSLPVPPQSIDDPLEQDLRIASYLRYAFLDAQTTGGGSELFPVVWVTLRKGDEAVQPLQMFALDTQSSTADASLMTFKWLDSDEALEKFKSSIKPTLTATVDGISIPLNLTNDPEFQQVGTTDFYFRLQAMQNNLTIGGTTVSLAQIELKKREKTWVRWVFDNAVLNRDVVEGQQHEGATFVDDSITMEYTPGAAPLTVVGGIRENEYILLAAIDEGEPTETTLQIGTTVPLTADVTLTLDKAEAFARTTTKPTLIPFSQRDPSASNMYSMVQVRVPDGESDRSVWLPYHHYPFESVQETVSRFQFKPTTIQLQDGKVIELLFSRRTAPLHAPLVLETFEIDSHLGGFTGSTSSILNWRSMISFLDGSSNIIAVSVNDPKPHGDLWFFQSQWDPPSTTSQGLNYTVLGVGNRRGVFQMLLGCCLTVLGMLWAFYVKPTIKRKRQQAVYNEVGI